MSESTQEKLATLRNFRNDWEKAIRARINALRTEKREVMDQYDAEIAELEAELALLGVPVADRPGTHNNTHLADQIYKFLCKQNGNLVSAFDINREFKSHGVLTVVLAEYLADGRIEKLGKSYRVMSENQPAAAT